MKLFHLVVSGSLGLFLYSILQVLWGPAGLGASTDLEAYKSRLSQNISQLETIQGQIESDITRLVNDTSRLQSEAYRIGMVATNEVRIRLPVSIITSHVSPGIIATKAPESGVSQAFIMGCSVSVSIVLLFLMSFLGFEANLLINRSGRARVRKPVPIQGVRAQRASLE